MSIKALRLDKGWSQEQLAQLSDLNVRTIQRVEKGESVGLETLRSLATIFEISVEELTRTEINSEYSETSLEQSDRDEALKKAKSIKYFYASSGFLVTIFILFMLPNYNGGENLGALIVVFLSFASIIAVHALIVFQPFGDKWEQKKVSEILGEQANKGNSQSEQ